MLSKRQAMDTLDSQLIALLRTNARMTVATMAHRCKVSRGTVANRIRGLERIGVITGYTVRLRQDSGPKGIHAWMTIAVDRDGAKAVVATLLGFPFVTALYDTNGRWDLLAELHAASLQDLSEALEHIRITKGILTSETSIHLATFRT